MEYGIRLDWGDVNDKETKPDWMRQKQPKPCECGMCFSCKEGITNGIYHQSGVKHMRKNAPNRTSMNKKQKNCSVERENFSSSRYCGSCYRKHRKENPGMSSVAVRQLVENKTGIQGGGKPRLGCLNCNERVCKVCWPTYDHYPASKNK